MRTASRFKLVYIRNLFLPCLCLLFILSLVLFSKTAVSSASQGINLWLTVVFPSLFPFFVGADLLNKSGIIRAVGVLLEPIMRPLFNVPGCGSFALLMGVTSGYPVGAKITTGMRDEKMLSKDEAERLLAFTNNSGPLFIIGAVSVGMFNMPKLGILLLTCHIAACITVGILFKCPGNKKITVSKNRNENILKKFKEELIKGQPDKDFGTIFGDAIRDSIMLILIIGGFIIFFSVIINLLLELGIISFIAELFSLILVPMGINKEIIRAAVSGFFEITTGINIASKAFEAPLAQRIVAASIILGWAGLSVHLQVLSIIRKTDIGIKPYITGKLLQGFIAGCYTYLSLKVLNLNFAEYIPTSNLWIVSGKDIWYSNLSSSIIYLLFSVSFLFICTFIAVFLKILSKLLYRYH